MNDKGCHMKKSLLSSIKYLRNEMLQSGRVLKNITPIDSDCRRRELLKKIQDVVLKTVRSAASGSGVPTLRLRPRRSQWKDCNFIRRLFNLGDLVILTILEVTVDTFTSRWMQTTDWVTIKAGNDVTLQDIYYTTQKKRFDVIFNLLSKIYRLLQTKGSMTKRELYYEQTELFENQAAVNFALLDICCILDASPWELRVFPTSKGLVAGALTITAGDKKVINCSKPGGVLVPQDVKGILKIESSAVFILVVEKDAAFQKLLNDGAHVKFGPCIIITGKGEPDTNTRLLLHRLCRDLAIPIFIVVDADPYGIEIMCTYRFGSLALSQHSEHLAVTEVLWVGIHPTDIDKFSIPTVPFTKKDFAKARDLASRPYIQQNEQLLEQVNCLLESGKKCEIENLAALSPTFLTDMFLSYKITSKEVI